MTHQSEQNNLQNSFEDTLKDSNLQGLVSNASEIAIDSVLDDGLLKDIPIIATMTSLIKLGANIQDRLFLKKIIAFLQPLKDVNADERKKMIDKIDDSQEYRVKVGEKLLYIIDKSDDYEISELVSKVFKYSLEENITFDEFLKTSSVLNNLTISDFKWFIKERDSYYFDLGTVGDLINTGLFELYYHDINVEVEKRKVDLTSKTNSKEYETEVDGGMSVDISRAGEIILEVFCPTYKKKKTVKI